MVGFCIRFKDALDVGNELRIGLRRDHPVLHLAIVHPVLNQLELTGDMRGMRLATWTFNLADPCNWRPRPKADRSWLLCSTRRCLATGRLFVGISKAELRVRRANACQTGKWS